MCNSRGFLTSKKAKRKLYGLLFSDLVLAKHTGPRTKSQKRRGAFGGVTQGSDAKQRSVATLG